MNTAQLKAYAPAARRAFIAAVTTRAALFGLTKTGTASLNILGDVVLIAGQAYPKKVADQRTKLERRIRDQGFDQVMEAMAYTWFNRFVAIRYMELHGYLEHGYRVLSHPEGKATPEILEHATEVALPGLDRQRVVELRLDGSKDEELYRLLLLSQCHALHLAMPFLFESLDDETELLLPDRLLHTDSLLRHLVEDIDENAWEQIEIIGWLYQFYISEKKEEVIGKVVKSEDIPAATQLFTPNWIVKYMIQNSLGAQWLATYPNSPLKGQMEYYIEPAEQTAEVSAQLAAMTPSTLNPEELTLIDPACGSGHILVEAYELFKAIYLERGYRQRDVAQLILEKNLFGLDIDERATQLSGFALMMKARADDWRLFERGVKLNVMALVDSAGFNAEALAESVNLGDYGLNREDLMELKQLFQHATTFGSLIQLPERKSAKLPALRQLSDAPSRDLFASNALKRLGLLVQQAELLATQYNAVVANPPYMGRKGMNSLTKEFLATFYHAAQNDLYAAFMTRARGFLRRFGLASFITRQDWMFTARNRPFREALLATCTLRCLLHVGPNAFPELSGEIVQGSSSVFWNTLLSGVSTVFVDSTAPDTEAKQRDCKSANSRFCRRQEDFARLPGQPLAYWASAAAFKVFDARAIESVSISDGQNKTAANEQFVRRIWEVSFHNVGQGEKWLPYAKGGGFRKWAGNITEAVNWSPEARAHYRQSPRCRIIPEYLWYKQGVTWSRIASAGAPNGFRILPAGSTFDMVGSSIFLREDSNIGTALGILNSNAAARLLQMLNPTVDLQVSDVRNIPFVVPQERALFDKSVSRLVGTAQQDWDNNEYSWNFQSLPILSASSEPIPILESSYMTWITQNRATIAEVKRLEEENNRLFINACGLANEITPIVPLSQITLTVNPAFRFAGKKKLSEKELWARFRQATMEELVSYAVGCMMGRYSLDEPGLIYANSGNLGFDPNRYRSFPADADGVIPVSDLAWSEDDAAERLVEFIAVAWDKAHLEQNLAFLADNLSPKQGESSRETLRRYLAAKFFKDHVQTYKKRPIYWLFSSGEQRAFQCLVYLHRYHEGTLSRMRTEYVIPLHGRFAARIEQLEADIARASSTVQGRKLEQERSSLVKQSIELQQFDEKLRHYADQRIQLDLDDGVKVNYGKFGDLLAEVDAVTGGSSD